MKRYTKKPVTIEAVQWDGTAQGAAPILAWIGGTARFATFTPPHILIETLEGTMFASPGDWVIRGLKGEFYPCKPDIFAESYDEELS